MKRLNLRTRLLAAVAAIALLQIGAGILIVTSTSSHLMNQVDERLAAAGPPGREIYFERERDDHDEPVEDHQERQEELRPERLSDTYEGLLASDGKLRTMFVSNSTGTDLAEPEISIELGRDSAGQPVTVGSADGDFRYRLTARPADDDALLVTAIPLTGVEAALSRLTTLVIMSFAGATAVLILVAWWVQRLGIGPIKRMTSTAEAIAASDVGGGDLAERIADVGDGTEAGQLGHALNTMLGRIESSMAERARAEDKLRQFIADASHELRTPVATIRGYAELYRVGGLQDPAELDDAMRRTEQESQRMSRLIADMLNLAKLDRQPTLEHRQLDMARLAADAVTDAKATYPDRSISADLTGNELIAHGDEDLLRQALGNLVTNAIVHTESSDRVTVSARADAGAVVLKVIDSGPGMSPEVAAQVTERFYRADPSRSRHKGGSGLGLAIADSVLRAHQGTLTITSAPGHGTTATITLPLNPDPTEIDGDFAA